jgi:SAM-dependent methyltransferase
VSLTDARMYQLGYALMYRLGVRPWERYGEVAAASIDALLDREEADRSRPLGRALDLGCGRGQKTRLLSRRGWEAVGLDAVRQAVDEARELDDSGATYAVGDVTDLDAQDLGSFDFFLDVGCLQGLNADQRIAEGRGVTALARPGATLLVLAFQPTPLRKAIGGVSQAEVEEAFAGWRLEAVDAAPTEGLGWPMDRTAPQWYRFRLAS